MTSNLDRGQLPTRATPPDDWALDRRINMKVLVIGATGFIGSVVAERLVERGHGVVALVQPGAPTEGLPAGSSYAVGDLADASSLRAAAERADAIINVSRPTGQLTVDAAATSALLEPLRRTGGPLIYTSGIWVLGATGSTPIGEDAATDPLPIVGYRPAIEQQVLAAAADGVRSVVIRPAIAHGRGGGIPALLVKTAREHGIGRYVGDLDVTWPMVHVDDLADLFVTALDRAPGGTLLHAVDEAAVPVVDIARAAAAAAGVDGVAPWPIDQARTALGPEFADALALSQACSGERARQLLGWSPRHPKATTDIASGSYASTVAA